MKGKILSVVASICLLVGATGCEPQADVVSRNLSISADNFEVQRRIVFYNGITDTYMLTIEGLCSLGNYDSEDRLSVTCQVGPSNYKKHFLGLSDNVTFFVEQLDPVAANPYRYRVMFRPATILPDIDADLGVR